MIAPFLRIRVRELCVKYLVWLVPRVLPAELSRDRYRGGPEPLFATPRSRFENDLQARHGQGYPT